MVLRIVSIALLGLVIGCGSATKGPDRASVSGTVTLDGEPVESGFIEFIPKPGTEGAPVKLTIKEGKYDTSTDPLDNRGIPFGPNRVEITAKRATGEKVKNMMGEMDDEYVQYIPEKYNAETELEAEITAETDELNYELVP